MNETPFDAADQEHDCPARARHAGLDLRTTPGAPADLLYGAAFTQLHRVRDRWWAHNGEYSTEVTYCPWCGVHLQGSGINTPGAGA